MQVESKSLTKFSLHLKITHKYRISFTKRPWRLFKVKALRERLLQGVSEKTGRLFEKKRMKFENFVIISFQITVNNNHYDKQL